MKQLYIIGILVAAVLLLLLGLTKLSGTPAGTEDGVANTLNDDVATTTLLNEEQDEMEVVEAEAEELSIQPTTDTMQANTDQDTADVATDTTTVVMRTNRGDITIELFVGETPVTAGNFLTLTENDFYDGVKFHRVIPNFMIQGGDPKTKNDALMSDWGTGGPGYAIQDEFVEGLSNVRGTLSMANSGPNTGGSQFFINTTDNLFLDNKHAVFGRVVEGMDVVDVISATPTGEADRPIDPVVIEDVEVQR